MSIFGVRLVAFVNNTGVVFEILGMVVFALVLLFFYAPPVARRGLRRLQSSTQAATRWGTFLAAMFMSLFVIYGFDTASTLAEETKNPRSEAPRAVIAAIVGAAIIGAIFLFATSSSPSRATSSKFVAGHGSRQVPVPAGRHDHRGNLPRWAANLYLFVVFAAIYVCCLAIQTSTIRLAFGMGRDGKLPFAKYYNNVHAGPPHADRHLHRGRRPGRPSAALLRRRRSSIAIGATGMIYLSYILGNIAILIARLRGWPKDERTVQARQLGDDRQHPRPRLGHQHGVNFLWPDSRRQPEPTGQQPAERPNPRPSSADIPLFEATLGVILIVGLVYWVVAQRGAPATPAIKPAEMGARA